MLYMMQVHTIHANNLNLELLLSVLGSGGKIMHSRAAHSLSHPHSYPIPIIHFEGLHYETNARRDAGQTYKVKVDTDWLEAAGGVLLTPVSHWSRIQLATN